MTTCNPKSRCQTIIPLFAEKPPHPLAPLICPAAAVRSAGQGRPLGRRPGALPLRGASTVARWMHAGRMVISAAVLCSSVFPTAVALAQSMAPNAQPSRNSETGQSDAYVSEAAQRFDIPASWIRAVMQVESGGNANAVSPKGAMGLMQLMPATYAAMRLRYGLGADPFQPQDNIIAGTAYLREMLDCYGTVGFLAAYNAGPARYDAHLATGQPLPAETLLYIARITPLLSGTRPSGMTATAAQPGWTHAPLFAGPVASSLTVAGLPRDLPSDRGPAPPPASSLAALIPRSNGIFAAHFEAASP